MPRETLPIQIELQLKLKGGGTLCVTESKVRGFYNYTIFNDGGEPRYGILVEKNKVQPKRYDRFGPNAIPVDSLKQFEIHMRTQSYDQALKILQAVDSL